MSNLTKFITKEFVVVPMQATDDKSAIEELLAPLRAHNLVDIDDSCLESIMKRERRMSTGVGKGVALPHGLSDKVENVAVVLGISPAGIDHKAVDGLLCHIFVLFIGPTSQPEKHHKLLSRFTKLLSEGELRSALMEVKTPEEALATLAEWDPEEDEEEI